MNRVEDLEAAITHRAEKLAAEYRERAERRKAGILKEADENLRLVEERETTAAKAQAELVYLRKMQAGEIRMRADMDHLRWGLVQGVEHRLKDRMEEFSTQEDAYLKTLQQYLAQGAASIESNELVAEVNHRDYQRLVERWDGFAADAAPGKRVTLAKDPINTVGGIRITSLDGRIRLDNTFEGRRDRLRSRLHQIIVERMFPATAGGGGAL